MSSSVLSLNPQLVNNSRLRLRLFGSSESQVGDSTGSDSVSLQEAAVLVFAGLMAATASMFIELNLKVPGHAILRSVFPMLCGLSIVPRRGAGTLMSIVALVFVGGFYAGGLLRGMSIGALTSLTTIGPALDFALRRTKSPGQIFLGCALAGMVANLLALLTRGGAKFLGLEALGKKPFEVWFGSAAMTYPICGLAAGLLSALVWFSFQRKSDFGTDSAERGES
ncbi:hypothetical protein KOR42_14800 [Thalassoglobus neptunius]|uniref:Uncharacterized protein n=1 Tax=Thalassoglobus neptunius TaxID=1938619 RepID=A0A5C5X643_9PLAN|nr:hypothetical protein [Thalassoglobus neptunius]TWT58109.1 hypothetical protein KOR42_14800 [Thalassoglobus neptunius]